MSRDKDQEMARQLLRKMAGAPFVTPQKLAEVFSSTMLGNRVTGDQSPKIVVGFSEEDRERKELEDSEPLIKIVER